jgi:hypothetical protein
MLTDTHQGGTRCPQRVGMDALLLHDSTPTPTPTPAYPNTKTTYYSARLRRKLVFD